MLLEPINAWLLVPDDYQTGLQLLRDTGYTGFTLTHLAKGENAYNRTRLETELRKWIESQNNSLPTDPAATRFSKENSEPVKFGLDYGVPGAKVVVMPKILPKSPESSEFQSPDEEPKEVLAIKKQIYALMDERSEAKAWLRAKEDLGNSPEACAIRFPYAVRIKDITGQIDDLYSQLDFFEEHGYLSPLASDAAMLVDDTRSLINMTSYVSRYKAKLKRKNLTPEQRQSAEKLLNQYSDEKARLEAKLSQSVTPSDNEK